MNDLSTKPYLIRAIYEWCGDNGFTPYLSVRVDEHTRVPVEHVKEGTIVLNIGAAATHHLVMDNEAVRFSARFGGVARDIYVPVAAVTGIYAKENGQGLLFQVPAQGMVQPATANAAATTPEPDRPTTPPTGGRPRLHVIK
ncbi:MAG: ClpXP protease specificity-enhancing factor [Pseudomonadota bacterium]